MAVDVLIRPPGGEGTMADANALIERGNELIQAGDLDGGPAPFDEALALDPSSRYAWWSKGCALGGAGRHLEAVTAYLKCSEVAPGRAMVWFNMGHQWQALGKFDQAITCFDMASQLDPDDPDPLINEGRLLDDAGKHAEAL